MDENDLAIAASTSHHTQSPSIEEIEDQDAHLRHNIPPKNPRRILESSEDEDDIREVREVHAPQPQPQKKVSSKEKTQSHHNIPSKKTHQTLESSENDDDTSPQPQKKVGPKRKIQSCSKESTGQSKRSSNLNSRQNRDDTDSEIEVIEKPEESPEQELGMSIQGTEFK